jgi:hypothetical protein
MLRPVVVELRTTGNGRVRIAGYRKPIHLQCLCRSARAMAIRLDYTRWVQCNTNDPEKSAPAGHDREQARSTA